jgi:hypothetical protein
MLMQIEEAFGETHLPQSAVYLTLTMTSVGSMILGSGRSSSLTSSLPWKTTAFIVSFDMFLVYGRTVRVSAVVVLRIGLV